MILNTLSGMQRLWIALPVPVLEWTVPSTPRSPPPPRVDVAGVWFQPGQWPVLDPLGWLHHRAGSANAV
jgi:hypothetical protein